MSHNTMMHRLVRPVVRRLAGTRVTPNQITTLRLVTGCVTAVAFAWEAWAFGGVLHLVSMLLDRADGELARQAGLISAGGHRYDLVADYTSNVLAFVGIGVGLDRSSEGGFWTLLGLLAGLAIIAIFALVAWIERHAGAGSALFPSSGAFDPDDAMLVVTAAALAGQLELLLAAAAVGAPAFLAWTLWYFRSHLRLGGAVAVRLPPRGATPPGQVPGKNPGGT